MLLYQLRLTFFWLDYLHRLLADAGHLAGGPCNEEPSFRQARGILHVTRDASPDEIKAAYRALALKYHPDRGGSNDAMERLNAAYAALTKGRGACLSLSVTEPLRPSRAG